MFPKMKKSRYFLKKFKKKTKQNKIIMSENVSNNTINNNNNNGNQNNRSGLRGSHKTWVFTLNNYNSADEEKFQALTCTHIVYGREIGVNGTPHLQGWVTFKTSKTFKKCKETICKKSHWEPGRAIDGDNYCRKDGDFFEKDSRQPGARNDIKKACVAVLEGGLAAAEDHMLCKYSKGLKEVMRIRAPKRKLTDPFEVYWLCGPSGSGKTTWAMNKIAEIETANALSNLDGASTTPSIYFEPDENNAGQLSFETYEGEHILFIDEFRNNCGFRTLLKLLEPYGWKLPGRNISTHSNFRRIYITSIHNPYDCYPNITEDKLQLIRRITYIYKFNSDHQYEDIKHSQMELCEMGLSIIAPGFGL